MKPYINCFTGAITHTLNNPNIQESNLMLLGKGFLLRSGYDEYGLPEITFPVQECGETALRALGIKFSHHPLTPILNFDELQILCESNPQGLVAWVNSTHLSYASLYSINLGYLHSIVIKKVIDKVVHVFDPLVVDIPPYAICGELSFIHAKKALTDTVKTDTYHLMGKLLLIKPAPDVSLSNHKKQDNINLIAKEFFQNKTYLNAIKHYQSINMEAYEKADDYLKKTLSRRIFDHIQVLYILPLLQMLKLEINSAKVHAILEEEIGLWKTIAMMALKNSKILSDRVFNKIILTLTQCVQMRHDYWECVLNESAHNRCG
ncbi:MAG TPA: hypothetical protein VHD33_06980 [Legionellaceae bacterium]|nr:hypothetical protein [Legionellaceae bacterium]